MNDTKDTNNDNTQLGKSENFCLFLDLEFELFIFSWRQVLQIGWFSQVKEPLKDSFLLHTLHVFMIYP